MKIRNKILTTRFIGGVTLAVATLVSLEQKTFAQSPLDAATHAAHVAAGTMPPDAPAATTSDPVLSQQLSELQAKVATLEAALAKTMPPMAATPAGGAMPGMSGAAPAASPTMGMDKMKSGGMPGMGAGAMPAPAMAGMSSPAAPAGGMGMMGMMDKMMGMMDKMMPMAGGAMPTATPAAAMPAGGGMGMMDMEKKKMAGMMGMGAMSSDTGATMPQSVLPGFPGASHLYHIGATGFFLDHPQHIALSTEQMAALNKAKEQSLLAKSTADRAIEQAEQELWTLTASDQPDAAKIESKIREIGKQTGDERLTFIRAVGDASKILTDEQRKILTGFAPPAPAMAAPAAAMPPMKGM